MPRFVFFRRYWTSILIVIALVASFVISRQDAAERSHKITSALVTACVASSQRTALNAAGFAALAERVGARGAKGDAESAKRYRAVSTGIITLIPAPIGHEGDPQIARATLIDAPGQEPRFVITRKTSAMQLRGCKDFYGVG
jgi:hypothetical protein